MPDLRLHHLYGVAGAMTHVYTLRQLCLLEDPESLNGTNVVRVAPPRVPLPTLTENLAMRFDLPSF